MCHLWPRPAARRSSFWEAAMTDQWECDDAGLVVQRYADGSVSFDIFDASEWQGGDHEGLRLAHLMTDCVNCHNETIGALEVAKAAMERENKGLEYPLFTASLEIVRTALTKAERTPI